LVYQKGVKYRSRPSAGIFCCGGTMSPVGLLRHAEAV
jgi:hypothetical protein